MFFEGNGYGLSQDLGSAGKHVITAVESQANRKLEP